jgi:hypothetical protein
LVSQLVYKPYLNNDGNLAYNNYYRQQLFLNLKCQEISQKDVEHLKYKKLDLERFFVAYSKCANSSYINFEPEKKRHFFNLSLRPGIDWSDLVIKNSVDESWNVNFNKELCFRFGVEAEFTLPLNKNKWGLILEPTYQYYKSERTKKVGSLSGEVLLAKVDYQSFELPFGLRHNFFLNDFSKIFVNRFYIFHLDNSSKIEFIRRDRSIANSLENRTRNNVALGTGYKYRDKYSIEMRYYTGLEILSDYVYWHSDYRKFSIIFGYTLF